MTPGKDLIVFIDVMVQGNRWHEAIAACKSCTVNLDQDFIDSCSPVQGRTKDKVSTGYSWSVDCDCLIPNTRQVDKLLYILKNGIPVSITFIIGGIRQTGTAFPKLKLSGGVTDLAKSSVSFIGSGPLEDTAGTAWDYHHGVLYTYGTLSDGTYTPLPNGTLDDGTFKKVTN